MILNAIIVENFYTNLVVHKRGDHEIKSLDPRWWGWTFSNGLVRYCIVKLVVDLIVFFVERN